MVQEIIKMPKTEPRTKTSENRRSRVARRQAAEGRKKTDCHANRSDKRQSLARINNFLAGKRPSGPWRFLRKNLSILIS
jgi:hypothetical protein